MTPQVTIDSCWLAWIVSWTIARLWVNRTEKRDALRYEVPFRLFLTAGLILLFCGHPDRQLYMLRPLWRPGTAISWTCVVLAGAGLSITWWARVHLGRLWSDLIVKKTGHRIIDTGPYRLVRHPIYSGLILAALATAAQRATPLSLLGVAVINVAFYTKARREERFLRAELGAAAYDTYARNTAMLIPFVRQNRI